MKNVWIHGAPMAGVCREYYDYGCGKGYFWVDQSFVSCALVE